MMRSAMKARKFLYAKQFCGFPSAANFQLVEEELPQIKDGEFLAQAEYLSVDPYQRSIMAKLPNNGVGSVMIGGQIAK
jgi:prostaglandin reductase 1